MENVINKLKFYNKKISLSERINVIGFEISDSIFNQVERDKINIGKNPYEKNIILKWILKEKYETLKNTIDLDFWIINNWGGIRGFKKNKKNIEKIIKFKNQIQTKKLSLDSFSTISSLSKISSFINPNEYIIYDSRVIFSLNWLILTCENETNFKQKYFPMPIGRNKIISDFNLNPLINIKHYNEYISSNLYYNSTEAYHNYCDLIKRISKIICGKDSKPFDLELLLFILADKEILEEIISKTNLNFNEVL